MALDIEDVAEERLKEVNRLRNIVRRQNNGIVKAIADIDELLKDVSVDVGKLIDIKYDLKKL